MNYLTASLKLTGRCSQSRKLENNTYLVRRGPNRIAVRLHSTDIVTFHANGTIETSTGGWDTVTTKDRINRYAPIRVWSEQGHMFAATGAWSDTHRQEVAGSSVTLKPDGTLVGDSADKERAEIREEINARNRPRNRARYWTNKARNGGTYRGTVESILQETNASVRVAKMQCYGIDKFFLDAKAEIVQEQSGYQLLALPFTSWESIRALKMSCTTTGAVYINTVPPQMDTIPEALDWMFDTTDYLGSVGQQA